MFQYRIFKNNYTHIFSNSLNYNGIIYLYPRLVEIYRIGKLACKLSKFCLVIICHNIFDGTQTVPQNRKNPLHIICMVIIGEM